MAVRIATSEPKPSPRNPGYHFFYFNKRTAAGGECVALLPAALLGLVHKGFVFDDGALRFNEELRGSVLELDFAEPPAQPAVPPDPESGWGDPDHLTSLYPMPAEQQQPRTAAQVIAAAPNRGARPETLRRQAAAASSEGIPPKLAQSLEITARAYNYVAIRIGVVEKPRAMEAKSLVITNLIPFFRENWDLDLTPEQLKDFVSSLERA